ncbi:MAG: hypothetical protein KME64_27615 [Scytonematopsis contorta HA4267-MV1]|nr:hypothetical protein [Scytonematopsis contorta HA4267-MV1]
MGNGRKAIPNSQFPIPNYQLPITNSQLPITGKSSALNEMLRIHHLNVREAEK